MAKRRRTDLVAFARRMCRGLEGPQFLAFIPALSLAAFWLGGEGALVSVALALPALYCALGAISRPGSVGLDRLTGLVERSEFLHALDRALATAAAEGSQTACVVLEIDDFADFGARHGDAAAEEVLRAAADRLRGALRTGDTLARIGEARFAVACAPAPRLDLEAAIQLAARLQRAVEQPVPLDATSIYMTASAGFCLAGRLPGSAAEALTEAASVALAEAQAAGPAGIRAFAHGMPRRAKTGVAGAEVAAALEAGQIVAWFQPQISTETGRISGFEALARWTHPERGAVPTSEFLPALESAGLMAQLGETMLYHALTALRAWDRSGLDVPRVSVNFSAAELRDPRLPDRIAWELDRFGLDPCRLGVEVLETVIARSPEDATTRGIRALGRMGCAVDLDDFGTGHASITALRRFDVSRVKIDRSLVAKCDRDPEQQRMVMAILSMSEQLGLDTLAEGVETAGEHALLAQLGCGHVQGYAIARPMPFEQTSEWIASQTARVEAAPWVGRNVG